MALVAYFDLQTNTSFNDEYARRWTIERLVGGRGLALWGINAGLIQIVAALPLAFVHLEPRFWRLPGVGFLALGAYFSYRSARYLGATPFWAAVAGAALTTAPLTLSLATGFMNETAFFGLMMAAAYFGLLWLQEDRGRVACLALSALATLQRQQGLGLLFALVLVLVWTRRERILRPATLSALAALAAASVAAIKLPGYFKSVGISGYVPPRSPDIFSFYRSVLVALPLMLGLLLIPFLVAMVRRGPRRRGNFLQLLPLGLAVVGVTGALGYLHPGLDMYPGNYWTIRGLGPINAGGGITGTKLNLLPNNVFLTIEVLTLLTFLVIFVHRRVDWDARELGAGRTFLVLLAISQFAVIMLTTKAFDRYYVLVGAPLAPVLASLVRQADATAWLPRVARAWALVSVLGALVVYAVGAQDYVAWQTAKDHAAQLAYQFASPSRVDAGFDETAEHVYIPAADHPGQGYPTYVQDPLYFVYFAPPGSSEPGYDYWSIHPGRMIVQRGPSCRPPATHTPLACDAAAASHPTPARIAWWRNLPSTYILAFRTLATLTPAQRAGYWAGGAVPGLSSAQYSWWRGLSPTDLLSFQALAAQTPAERGVEWNSFVSARPAPSPPYP